MSDLHEPREVSSVYLFIRVRALVICRAAGRMPTDYSHLRKRVVLNGFPRYRRGIASRRHEEWGSRHSARCSA